MSGGEKPNSRSQRPRKIGRPAIGIVSHVAVSANLAVGSPPGPPLFGLAGSQKISGSHNNVGKPNTATTVPTFTKPSSLGLDNHSHRLTLRGTVKFSIENDGGWCRRQATTRKLAKPTMRECI